MTAKFDTVEYTIPVYYICYIVYGDIDDLSDDEIDTIDTFLEEVSEEYPDGVWEFPDDTDSEKEFTTSNDVDDLGGDTVTAKWNYPID